MNKNIRIKQNKGFTLAELLIVVAIVVILVAISIPIFSGKLEAARAATCESNRRSLKADLSADLMSGKDFTQGNISNKTLKSDYNKNFDFDEFCPKNGKITAEFNGSSFTVYCSEHYNKAYMGNQATMDTLFDLFGSYNVGQIDSGAVGDLESFALKVSEALEKEGIDLDALGANSWRYEKKDQLLYWTPTDITGLSPGTTVPTIRYNAKTGTYTVWMATVATGNRGNNNGQDYNILSDFKKYDPSTSQDKSLQTYENALNWLKQASE